MRRGLVIGIMAALALATAGAIAFAVGKFETGAAPPSRVAQIRDRNLPDLMLTDHTGRQVRFYRDLVRGRVVAINFFYTACSRTCTLSSQNIARVQDLLGDQLGRDVHVYSISLDPEHDTPDAIAAYRTAQGARPGWTFLTARSVAEITELRQKLGVREPDPVADADISSHANTLVIGNEPQGRWSMVPALVHPVRIGQALERVRLPPDQWPRGAAVVEALPREDNDTALKR